MRDMYGNIIDMSTVKPVLDSTAEEEREYVLKQAIECERLAVVHARRGRPKQAADEAAKAARYRVKASQPV